MEVNEMKFFKKLITSFRLSRLYRKLNDENEEVRKFYKNSIIAVILLFLIFVFILFGLCTSVSFFNVLMIILEVFIFAVMVGIVEEILM